jgi:hypothetical protein
MCRVNYTYLQILVLNINAFNFINEEFTSRAVTSLRNAATATTDHFETLCIYQLVHDISIDTEAVSSMWDLLSGK